MEKLVREALKKYRWFSSQKWAADWGYKVLSMIFALLMWYFVVGEDKVDLTIYVPIEITNLPQSLIISNQFRKQLEVTISGPRGLVRSISSQHITRSIDLANAKPGTQVFQNKPESINLPRGITIQRIQPANITLTIDKLLEKELPIKPVLTGEPAEGFEILSVTAKPAMLSLKAPAEALKDTLFLVTQPIEVNGRNLSLTNRQVALDVKPEIAELIGESLILVNVVIREKTIPREFSDIPVEFSHAAERTAYQLSPASVTVKVELPYHLAQSDPAPVTFTATVDAEARSPGRYDLPVTVAAQPEGIQIIEVIPPRVRIRIGRPGPVMKRPLNPGQQPAEEARP
jgi:YbbR domain-containing protein